MKTLGPVDMDSLRSRPTTSAAIAAEALGISLSYAYEMIKDGRLPAITLGPRRVRVLTAGLLEMLEGNSPVNPTASQPDNRVDEGWGAEEEGRATA